MIVLFTYAASMAVWKRTGLITRETGYYQFLRKEGGCTIRFLTYGADDKLFESEVKPFGILPKIHFRHNFLFALLAPFLYLRAFQAANIYKSNQVQGAWIGLIAKLLNPGAKFVVRAGWIPTLEMMQKDWGYPPGRIRRSQFVQNLSYRYSDLIIVTASADKNYLCAHHHVRAEKITIIPNSINTDLFYPAAHALEWDRPVRVISVGRLVQMKNYQNLITAVQGIQKVYELVLIGEGPYRLQLEKLARRTGARVRLLRALPNDALPEYLRHAHVFIMPQLYGSGMSKVMIEAMACGLIVMGSNIPAHREVIRDGQNGFLCGTGPGSIGRRLQSILDQSPSLLNRIARQAVRDVRNRYSMQANARRELSEIRRVLGQPECR